MRNSLVGRRFGHWLVEADAGIRVGKRKDARKLTQYWHCLCDCGRPELVRATGLISGGSTQCNTCGNLARAKTLTLPNSGAARHEALGQAKRVAQKRGYAWYLSDEQYYALTQQSCRYCGKEPSHIFKSRTDVFIYNGIDRADNTQGYTRENSVPCCGRCNSWKSAMNAEEFIAHAKQIVRHLENGNA
jgi:hypothetical protein